MVQLNFDASRVQPATGTPDPIPVTAWYPCAIVESEQEPTKDNTGSFLKLTLEVLDGPYKGRRAWDRLNLVNNSAQAVEIAYRTLSAICHATGVIQCADSAQLHNRPMAVKISYRPAGERDGKHFEASNDVKGYKPISELNNSNAGQPAAAPAAGGAFAPPPAPAAAPAPAWGAPPAAATGFAPPAAGFAPPAAAPAGAPWGAPPAAAPATPAYQPPPSAPAAAAPAAAAPAAAPAAGWTPPPTAAGPQPPWAAAPAQ